MLPDGLGDLIFGENAVEELLDVGPVAWVRCHVSDEQLEPGEQLVAKTAEKLSFSLASTWRVLGMAFGGLFFTFRARSSGKSSLCTKISRGPEISFVSCGSRGAGRLEELWAGARQRFLAPWIFGLSENDQAAALWDAKFMSNSLDFSGFRDFSCFRSILGRSRGLRLMHV